MKIIIWGHKTNGHTHSHIHYGYYRAFLKMGYETYWFDDVRPESLGIDFHHCLFFTEGQVDKNIPIRNDCKYVLHHCDSMRYPQNNILNLGNYLKYCEDGISPNHKENTVEKIKDLCFFDRTSRTLYQTWATDLLPEEININDAMSFNEGIADIHFIGYVWHENQAQIKAFSEACAAKGKQFHTHFGISYSDNRKLVRESYISPDFRGSWHVECGYVPCRVFKNISYGVPLGTNSAHVKNLFPDFVAHNEDCYKLFDSCVSHYRALTVSKIQDAMLFVKSNHTYVNRVENLMLFL